MYNFKQVEQMLKDYPVIKAEIKNIDMDLIEVENSIGLKGISDNPRPSTPTYKFNSSVENEVISPTREKMINHLMKEKNIRQKKIDRIENALSILSEKDEEIVRLYYFKQMPIAAIAYKLDRTSSQVYRRRSYAVSSMVNILNIGMNMLQKCDKNASKMQ